VQKDWDVSRVRTADLLVTKRAFFMKSAKKNGTRRGSNRRPIVYYANIFMRIRL
jgi:hypothetical protein